jgi:hypothetical protein
MLRELKKEIVNQPEKGVTRRVFVDDGDHYFDLYVWYDVNKALIGFQLCYDRMRKAFTWLKEKGFKHQNISKSRFQPWAKDFLLLPDGVFDSRSVREKFLDSAKNLDPDVTALIDRVLQNPEQFKNPGDRG